MFRDTTAALAAWVVVLLMVTANVASGASTTDVICHYDDIGPTVRCRPVPDACHSHAECGPGYGCCYYVCNKSCRPTCSAQCEAGTRCTLDAGGTTASCQPFVPIYR
ncbi:uncharacterized protein LOC119090384 [Pollicipes pollicipes]|uniref:uncharacterized protein LOC119090384 n=1 Tax=Pollicipes pollicipes TaxID=41117 RepID=UPI0018851726|nr:uncharacterized protein LOC119090384 [Pollicipes pollicipes]